MIVVEMVIVQVLKEITLAFVKNFGLVITAVLKKQQNFFSLSVYFSLPLSLVSLLLS
jgi:hypothetical protein